MNKNLHVKTPDQIVEAIFALDLETIKFKLMDKKEGHGWCRATADRYELEYKRFLALIAKFPNEVIAPNKAVDKFWHGHILDTIKYEEDCIRVFGHFVHHFPYFGMRGEADAVALAEAAVNMQRLYQQEFGAPAAKDAAYCGVRAGIPKPEGATAYCGVRIGNSERKPKGASAYCGVRIAKPASLAQQATAYCGVRIGKAARS